MNLPKCTQFWLCIKEMKLVMALVNLCLNINNNTWNVRLTMGNNISCIVPVCVWLPYLAQVSFCDLSL